MKKIAIQDILDYEVRSHWLAYLIPFEWGQRLVAKYIVWKTLRKYKRYEKIYKII